MLMMMITVLLMVNVFMTFVAPGMMSAKVPEWKLKIILF